MKELEKTLEKFAYYKELLIIEKNNSSDIKSSSFALKTLRLVEYYEQTRNFNAIKALVLTFNIFTTPRPSSCGLSFEKMPKETVDRILTLYSKRINTMHFGTKNDNDYLDDLINENY